MWKTQIAAWMNEWYGAILLGLGLVAFVSLLIWAIANTQPAKNCRETEETRITWIMSGKTLIPITQHKYICTTEEWH